MSEEFISDAFAELEKAIQEAKSIKAVLPPSHLNAMISIAYRYKNIQNAVLAFVDAPSDMLATALCGFVKHVAYVRNLVKIHDALSISSRTLDSMMKSYYVIIISDALIYGEFVNERVAITPELPDTAFIYVGDHWKVWVQRPNELLTRVVGRRKYSYRGEAVAEACKYIRFTSLEPLAHD